MRFRYGRGAVGALFLLLGGCAGARLRETNSTPFVAAPVRATDDGRFVSHFKAIILYPARDLLTGDPLWRLLFGDEAWYCPPEGVTDSSFFTCASEAPLTPEQAAAGPDPTAAPVQPFHIDKVKHGATHGFYATDVNGHKYLVKLDHPEYPELGSSAAAITTRIYHALGYHVPAVFPLTISGTGDARFDGRRAAASPLIDDVVGHFQFDWFRYRREVRVLRLVAAWLNDTDRTSANTLVTVQNGVGSYYLIDFNSSLGAWQGRPKEPWRGWRTVHGFAQAGYNPRQPVVSSAVGRFDANLVPMNWQPQLANTAFDHMTDADRRWIIGRIAQLQRSHLEAIVDAAGLSRAEDRAYLVETLLARQARILARADGASDGPPTTGEP
jgi:hypothetical protein